MLVVRHVMSNVVFFLLICKKSWQWQIRSDLRHKLWKYQSSISPQLQHCKIEAEDPKRKTQGPRPSGLTCAGGTTLCRIPTPTVPEPEETSTKRPDTKLHGPSRLLHQGRPLGTFPRRLRQETERLTRRWRELQGLGCRISPLRMQTQEIAVRHPPFTTTSMRSTIPMAPWRCFLGGLGPGRLRPLGEPRQRSDSLLPLEGRHP